MKLYISIFFGLALGLHSYGAELSLKEKREKCYELMAQEFESVLNGDNSLLQAKLTEVGIKLAQIILKQNGDTAPESLKSFSDALVNEDFLKRLEQDPELMKKVISLYEAREENKEIFSPKLEVYAELKEMVSGNRLSDAKTSGLLAHLSAQGKDFDKEDVALTWFVDRASQNFDGKESHYVEGIVQAVINAKGAERDRLIAKNLARARLKIRSGLARTKEKVIEANRSLCLEDYRDPLNAQHRSVFQGCRGLEESIVDSAFMKGLSSLLRSKEFPGFDLGIGLLPGGKRVLTSDQIRAVQDEINSDKYTSKERVIEYYRRGLYPEDGSCETFTLVDKKSGQTSVYGVDGEEIFTTPSIKAYPREGENQVVFNPDSELRKFENGTYTRSTSAGVFYTILDMPKEERKRRRYDEEFDDRVFVISPRERDGSGYRYDDRTTIALHGVPINGWVKNADERLQSFEGEDRALSTGCVNLEGYAYDLMNELSQNHCPVYIVPEDDKNYFHIKNREVVFSTSVPERKKGSEPAKKCAGVVKVEKGQALCDGEWIADEKNVNLYYFGELSKEVYHQKVVVDGDDRVARALFADEKRLTEKVVAGNIDSEDFEDLAALSHGLASSKEDAESVFKDLYNSFYELKHYQFVNFDLMPAREKRKQIVEYYLDPKGLKKSRENKGKSLYFQTGEDIKVKDVLKKAQEVRFVHEDA